MWLWLLKNGVCYQTDGYQQKCKCLLGYLSQKNLACYEDLINQRYS
jgi:hypothetical protein